MELAPELGSPEGLLGYITARKAEFPSIEPARREELLGLAHVISERRDAGELALTFICTHNSRRSQMSQVWARTAAEHCGMARVATYSGGTETTAFNPRAVAALERAGFRVESAGGGENPVYRLSGAGVGQGDAIECFSKTIDDVANPRSNFIAVMTCSAADEACPIVAGASERISLTYLDPKAFDGTEEESEAYDERCAQIARELLFVFENAARTSSVPRATEASRSRRP